MQMKGVSQGYPVLLCKDLGWFSILCLSKYDSKARQSEALHLLYQWNPSTPSLKMATLDILIMLWYHWAWQPWDTALKLVLTRMGGTLGSSLVGCGFSGWTLSIVLRKDWRSSSRGFFSGKDAEAASSKLFLFCSFDSWAEFSWGKLGILLAAANDGSSDLLFDLEVSGERCSSVLSAFNPAAEELLRSSFFRSVSGFGSLWSEGSGPTGAGSLGASVCSGSRSLYRLLLARHRRSARERFRKRPSLCRVVGPRGSLVSPLTDSSVLFSASSCTEFCAWDSSWVKPNL